MQRQKMTYKNPFKGVNAKCRQCAKRDCKQFENTIVCYCPNFVPIASKTKKHIPSEHEKSE